MEQQQKLTAVEEEIVELINDVKNQLRGRERRKSLAAVLTVARDILAGMIQDAPAETAAVWQDLDAGIAFHLRPLILAAMREN